MQEEGEADNGAKEEEWNQLAPGVESDAYKPKATPAIPLAPPLLPTNGNSFRTLLDSCLNKSHSVDTHDTGRTPNAFTERKDIEGKRLACNVYQILIFPLCRPVCTAWCMWSP